MSSKSDKISSNGDFSTMDKKDLKKLASKGGKHSHDNDYKKSKDSKSYKEDKGSKKRKYESGSEDEGDKRSYDKGTSRSKSPSNKKLSKDHLPNSTSHEGHRIIGLKATLHNDRVSEKAKKHARKELERLGGGKLHYVDTDAAKYSREHYDQYHNRKSGSKSRDYSNDASDSDDNSSGSDDEDRPHHHPGHGRQGFASMSKEKQQKIASMGGRTRHAGESPQPLQSESEESGDDSYDHRKSSSKSRSSKSSRSSRSSKSRKYDSDSESDSDSDEDHPHRVPGHGKQGFASMSKSKQQKIASMGGRTRNAGESPQPLKSESEESGDDSYDYRKSSSKSGKSSKSSNKRKYESDSESDSDDDDHPHRVPGHGKQGFASMSKEKQQKIASMGGRTRNAGESPQPLKSDDENSEDDSRYSKSSSKSSKNSNKRRRYE